jgi:hypothetical protein
MATPRQIPSRTRLRQRRRGAAALLSLFVASANLVGCSNPELAAAQPHRANGSLSAREPLGPLVPLIEDAQLSAELRAPAASSVAPTVSGRYRQPAVEVIADILRASTGAVRANVCRSSPAPRNEQSAIVAPVPSANASLVPSSITTGAQCLIEADWAPRP